MRISDWSSDVCSADLKEWHNEEDEISHRRSDRRDDGSGRGAGADPRDPRRPPRRSRRTPRGSRCTALWRPRRRARGAPRISRFAARSEDQTSELQSLIRISYSIFFLKTISLEHTKKSP